MRKKIINDANLIIEKGDITKSETDAIVNAANGSLMGGGGVDGAIHRAGGPAILAECKKVRAELYKEGLPTGEAVITSGGNLKAKFVIHTVGPVWCGGAKNEPELLRNAYHNSLKVCEENNLKSISFPAISTGVYSYPMAKAAKIALLTVIEYLKISEIIKDVRFVLFSEDAYSIFNRISFKL